VNGKVLIKDGKVIAVDIAPFNEVLGDKELLLSLKHAEDFVTVEVYKL
jgi:hypothetical protein